MRFGLYLSLINGLKGSNSDEWESLERKGKVGFGNN